MKREKIQSSLEKYVVTEVVNCKNDAFMHIGVMYLMGVQLYVLRIFGDIGQGDEIFVNKDSLHKRYYEKCGHYNCPKGSVAYNENGTSYFAEVRYITNTIENVDYKWIEKGELLINEKVYFIEKGNKEREYYYTEEKAMAELHKQHRIGWDNRTRGWTKLRNFLGEGGIVFLNILLILLFLGMLGGAIFGIYYAIHSAIDAPHTKGSRNGLIIFGMMASTMAMGGFIMKSRGGDD